jgi:hypothetical protein
MVPALKVSFLQQFRGIKHSDSFSLEICVFLLAISLEWNYVLLKFLFDVRFLLTLGIYNYNWCASQYKVKFNLS